VGTDPDDECAPDMASVCGRTGACGGVSGCALAPAGLACGDSSCSGNTLTPPPRCSGTGLCEARPTEVCPGGLLCAGGGVCKANCVSDADCVTGTFCDGGTGRCRAVKANGSTCDAAAAGSDCQSGSCVDGFCCETACQSLCTACAMTKTGAANGRCAPIRAGVDPDNECAAQDPASCGRDGSCNGAGACRLWADGTTCGTTCCDSGPGRGARPCAYACVAGVCRTDQPIPQQNACGNLTCCCPTGGPNGQAACTLLTSCPSGTCQ
jgi:hypothetical protein